MVSIYPSFFSSIIPSSLPSFDNRQLNERERWHFTIFIFSVNEHLATNRIDEQIPYGLPLIGVGTTKSLHFHSYWRLCFVIILELFAIQNRILAVNCGDRISIDSVSVRAIATMMTTMMMIVLVIATITMAMAVAAEEKQLVSVGKKF